MNPDCNPIEQQAVQDRLEAAYQASGRDHLPDGHPHKSTYTGLAETEFFKTTQSEETDGTN